VTLSRRALRLAGLVTVALLATGCAGQLPGAAGVVGEARISDTQLSDAVAETQDALVTYKQRPVEVSTLTRLTLDRLMTSELLAVAAQRRNLVVPQGAVDREVAAAEQQAGVDALRSQLAANRAVPPSAINSFARDFLIQQRLAASLAPTGSGDAQSLALQKYLSALSRELDTRVSPRFGTWDAAQLTIGPVPDNLATEAATPLIPKPSDFPTPVNP